MAWGTGALEIRDINFTTTTNNNNKMPATPYEIPPNTAIKKHKATKRKLATAIREQEIATIDKYKVSVFL